MTGVYAQMSTNTTVNIKIYVPPGFLLYKPEVFVRRGLFVNVTSLLKQDNMQVDTYGTLLLIQIYNWNTCSEKKE